MNELLSVIVVLFGSGGVIVALIEHFGTKRDRLSKAFHDLADAQLRQEEEIKSQDDRLTRIIAERNLMMRHMDTQTAYIRALGHWMDSACRFIDPDFVNQNPKPHLPDELRDSVGLVHITYGGSDETTR